MDPLIRPATADEIPAMLRVFSYGFGGDPHPGDAEQLGELMNLERTRCAFDGDEMVATSGVYDLELAVPGGTLRTGGTTAVSVRTSHRRRGLLRAMMLAHLEDVAERGEPLAALWASESSIYRRFGYGRAADMYSFTVERPYADFEAPLAAPGRVRLIDADEAAKVLPEVYERLWRERPGHLARSGEWWRLRRLFDAEHVRQGASKYRYALYENGGDSRGYVQYRVKQSYDDVGFSRGAVWVHELYGSDAAARAALWRLVLDIDLNEKVEAWNQPADCELPWLLADTRRALAHVRDSLWVRLLDVAAGLEGRRYARAGHVVLGLRDPFWPANEGTWRLEGGPEGAVCKRSREAAEIRLDVSDLGSVYLGGNRLRALARAGRVEGSPEALARADAMFAWDPAPWCPEIF